MGGDRAEKDKRGTKKEIKGYKYVGKKERHIEDTARMIIGEKIKEKIF